jgi:hypothetical protein
VVILRRHSTRHHRPQCAAVDRSQIGEIMFTTTRFALATVIAVAGLTLAGASSAFADTGNTHDPTTEPTNGGVTLTYTGDASARKNERPAGNAQTKSKKELCSALVGTLNSDLQQLAWANAAGNADNIAFWRDQVAKDFAAGGYMGCGWAA